MGKNFHETLKEQMQDPEFRAEWEAPEPERQIIKPIVEGREENDRVSKDVKDALIASGELEDAAERAGGYVLPPESFKLDEKRMEEFIAIRCYCIETGKPISQLTEEDYRKIGVSPRKPKESV